MQYVIQASFKSIILLAMTDKQLSSQPQSQTLPTDESSNPSQPPSQALSTDESSNPTIIAVSVSMVAVSIFVLAVLLASTAVLRWRKPCGKQLRYELGLVKSLYLLYVIVKMKGTNVLLMTFHTCCSLAMQ